MHIFKTIEVKFAVCFVTQLFYLTSSISAKAQTYGELKADKAAFDQSKSLDPLKGNAVQFKPLQGGVYLSRRLPPVPSNLHKGAIFSKVNISKIPVVNGWYWIPSWLAGSWHRETMTDISPWGFEHTYTERADHLWGHQADRFGNIWHHHNEPFIQTIEQKYKNYSKTITILKPLTVTGDEVVMYYKDITVQFNKYNLITETYQHEQVSKISHRGDQLVEEIWAKNFDQNGKSFRADHGKTTYTKLKDFHPTQIDKSGLDLKKNFQLFLLSHKLTDRLPIDSSLKQNI